MKTPKEIRSQIEAVATSKDGGKQAGPSHDPAKFAHSDDDFPFEDTDDSPFEDTDDSPFGDAEDDRPFTDEENGSAEGLPLRPREQLAHWCIYAPTPEEVYQVAPETDRGRGRAADSEGARGNTTNQGGKARRVYEGSSA